MFSSEFKPVSLGGTGGKRGNRRLFLFARTNHAGIPENETSIQYFPLCVRRSKPVLAMLQSAVTAVDRGNSCENSRNFIKIKVLGVRHCTASHTSHGHISGLLASIHAVLKSTETSSYSGGDGVA